MLSNKREYIDIGVLGSLLLVIWQSTLVLFVHFGFI